MDFSHLIYPARNEPLLDAFGGRYEAAYIALHPFVSVPEWLGWAATGGYPDDAEILAHGARVPWAQVARSTGIPNGARMSQGLLTSIGALHEDFMDREAARLLTGFLRTNPVWMPVEGRFEPLLQASFLAIFQAAGRDRLIWVPEFPDMEPAVTLNLEQLRTGGVPFPTRGTLAAEDESFLLTVDWDSFFTLFYGPHEFVRQQTTALALEGFFAEAATEHQWFHYKMGCATVTVSPDGWPRV